MIRNQCSYLTPFVQKKGEDALKITATQSKYCKQKAKMTVPPHPPPPPPQNGQTAIQNKIKKSHQAIYAKTTNDRNSKSQQKNHLRTLNKNTGAILRGHNACSQFCRGIHKTFLQSAWRVFNKKEGNDQEMIQLSNTFRPRHKRERRTHLKQRHHKQTTTSRELKGHFLIIKILAKWLSKINISSGHTCKDIQWQK